MLLAEVIVLLIKSIAFARISFDKDCSVLFKFSTCNTTNRTNVSH